MQYWHYDLKSTLFMEGQNVKSIYQTLSIFTINLMTMLKLDFPKLRTKKIFFLKMSKKENHIVDVKGWCHV